MCHLQRRPVVTTDSRHRFAANPNLLANHVLTGLNQAWVGDITYIRLPREFVYLASILDAILRRVIGWAVWR